MFRADPMIPHLYQQHENITVNPLCFQELYIASDSVFISFWKQEEGWWEGGGVILHPGLNYEDIIYMKWPKLVTVAKCPGYNYFLSSAGYES